MRATASHSPRAAPCSASAVSAYSLHDGANLHRGPSSGLTNRRYPAIGVMSSRAGTVAVRTGPFAVSLPGITDACPNLPPQQPADHQVQIRGEIRLACVRGRGIRAHHKKATARKRLKVPAHELAEPPLDAVSGHRGADRPANDQSYPGWFTVVDVRPHEQMAHHARPARADAGTHGQRELRATAHPELGRQDQALSRSRPLCLRAARTARPARVRMRSRKPCVLARRRLFGWNVRLLTGAPGKGLDYAHARSTRAVLGFITGYHLEHRCLPGVPRLGGLGCGKLFFPAATVRSRDATCTTCG
jgi:hypothetical protein